MSLTKKQQQQKLIKTRYNARQKIKNFVKKFRSFDTEIQKIIVESIIENTPIDDIEKNLINDYKKYRKSEIAKKKVDIFVTKDVRARLKQKMLKLPDGFEAVDIKKIETDLTFEEVKEDNSDTEYGILSSDDEIDDVKTSKNVKLTSLKSAKSKPKPTSKNVEYKNQKLKLK